MRYTRIRRRNPNAIVDDANLIPLQSVRQVTIAVSGSGYHACREGTTLRVQASHSLMETVKYWYFTFN